MQQPHYNKDLDVRQIGTEDLPHARLVAGRAFMEHAEDWYGEDETTLAGFDGEGTMVCALGYQLESLWWGAAQIPAGAKPPENLRATVSFEVADWVVNADKPLAVTVQAEGGQVQVSEKAAKDSLCCDINTFTQLFAGGLTVAQAWAMGRLTGGNPAVGAACDALLYGRVPYRSDVEVG